MNGEPNVFCVVVEGDSSDDDYTGVTKRVTPTGARMRTAVSITTDKDHVLVLFDDCSVDVLKFDAYCGMYLNLYTIKPRVE